jgi:hypothetical protein
MTTQALEKENKKFLGRRHPEVMRISEATQDAEWPGARVPGCYRVQKLMSNKVMEVDPGEIYRKSLKLT